MNKDVMVNKNCQIIVPTESMVCKKQSEESTLQIKAQ